MPAVKMVCPHAMSSSPTYNHQDEPFVLRQIGDHLPPQSTPTHVEQSHLPKATSAGVAAPSSLTEHNQEFESAVRRVRASIPSCFVEPYSWVRFKLSVSAYRRLEKFFSDSRSFNALETFYSFYEQEFAMGCETTLHAVFGPMITLDILDQLRASQHPFVQEFVKEIILSATAPTKISLDNTAEQDAKKNTEQDVQKNTEQDADQDAGKDVRRNPRRDVRKDARKDAEQDAEQNAKQVAESKTINKHPDASLAHLSARAPGIIIEVAHSQRATDLPILAEELIRGSRGKIRCVVGFKLPYPTGKQATVSVWRAKFTPSGDGRMKLAVEDLVKEEVFRDNNGLPNTQSSGLCLSLAYLAPTRSIAEQINDLPEHVTQIRISAAKLCEYFNKAQNYEKTVALDSSDEMELDLEPPKHPRHPSPEEVSDERLRQFEEEEEREDLRQEQGDSDYMDG
ncbi:uncharacterized protein PV07_08613 [Cladophialophora immunda]|uniref:Uncharacterized protein n=1 Tax=Cladophialophora immunda TaxID=569365 RepID=A0A0D2C4Q1_9EURO|nr:uncharacterized protein PV07_08613 [Cladophialophora immunda]KIW25440.1 hypothetical protein PV07_08613 [Cladophialophora immunda]